MAGFDQKKFLHDAMASLGNDGKSMTRAEFAKIIGASTKALDNWLLPESAKGHRAMPNTTRILINYILLFGIDNSCIAPIECI